MKRKIIDLLSIAMSCMMLFAMLPSASAVALRSSDRFGQITVEAQATGSGAVTFEFDINATHTMKELGASQVVIYEQQSSGMYKSVKTYTRNSTSGLIATNTAAAYGNVTYGGTSGKKYYATFTLYAKDSDNTSETVYKSTSVVTA